MALKKLPEGKDGDLSFYKQTILDLVEVSEKTSEITKEQGFHIERLIKVLDTHLELIKLLNQTMMEHLEQHGKV